MFARFVVDAASYVAAVVMAIGPIYAADYQDNLLSVVVTARQDYPTPMEHAQIGELVTRVAHIGGPEWGVLLKPSGSNCPSPVGMISCDIIVHIPTEQEYDILTDAEGKGVPSFTKLPFRCGQPPSGCEMARVRAIASAPAPPSPVPPTPPASDLAAALKRIERLELELAQVRDHGNITKSQLDINTRSLREQIDADVRDLKLLIDAIAPGAVDCTKLPPYKGTLGWFGSITSKPVCK